MSADRSLPVRPAREPWFGRYPVVALAVAGALTPWCFLLRLIAGERADSYFMLFALPVALVVIAFGPRAGVGAALVAVGLIVLWHAAPS